MRLKLFYQRREAAILGVASVIAFIVLWEMIGQFRFIDPLFTSYPTLILNTGMEMFGSGEIYDDVLVSFEEFFYGYIASVFVGILFGLLMARWETFNQLVAPFVNAMYSTPRIALLPLFIMWFGIGLMSKVVVVFLGALFPILINTYEGAKSTDPTYIEAARSYGASRRDVFFKIILIATLPFVVVGLRLGIGRGLISMVVAELFGANKGLGFIITVAGATFQTSRLFVAAMCVVAFALVFNYILKAVEWRIAPWLHERQVE